MLDQSLADDIAAIRALHPGDPVFASADDADATWLLAFTNDSGPVPYFAYDRASRQGSFLFDHQPALSQYTLAPMVPFSFPARDGLVIHGYATFPPEAATAGLPDRAQRARRAVGAERVGLRPEAQWLANRGYLCLQVNFRGSTGYGKAFVNAGDKEWGAKMQDDLTDAVAFAIAQGWADPAASRDLRRLLRRLRRAGGRDVHARRLLLRGGHRRAVQSQDADRDRSRRTGLRMIAQFHRRVGDPEKDVGLPVVALAALPGRPDLDPAADRPGRERPAGQAGRVRADRRRDDRAPGSTTSTCCSPTRAMASPSRRTG